MILLESSIGKNEEFMVLCLTCNINFVFQSLLAKLSVGQARSVAYNHDGEMIAVGLKNGEFMVLLANGLKVWGKRRDRAGSINDVRLVDVEECKNL